MKCLIAVALLAVMVTYCSANSSSVNATTSVGPSMNATTTYSQADASMTTTMPATTAETHTTPTSSGVSVLPSVLVMTVAVLVAALK